MVSICQAQGQPLASQPECREAARRGRHLEFCQKLLGAQLLRRRLSQELGEKNLPREIYEPGGFFRTQELRGDVISDVSDTALSSVPHATGDPLVPVLWLSQLLGAPLSLFPVFHRGPGMSLLGQP